MYIDLKREEAVKRDAGFKLCYIDSIPETYYDYTPEAKAYRETEEWKEQDRLREEKFHREGCMSSNDPEFGLWANPILSRGAECQDYPHPDYIPGKQEYYAYFTGIDLKDQWGDDWDDSPYEYNAGTPYDDYTDKDDNRVEYPILRVPFYLNFNGWDIKLPRDWGGCNSPFCVRDINAGAVAWIFYSGNGRKSSEGSIAIHAGCSPADFFEKIDKINKATTPDEYCI